MKKSMFFICVILLPAIHSLPVHASLLNIYVSIPPQHWLAEQIAGNLATTEILLEKGQDPHTFEPTPRQIAGLSKAELYFTIGMIFEEHLTEKLTQTNSGLTIVDSSDNIRRRSGTDHHHESHDTHGASHSEPDPHIWLSPVNLITIAGNMAKAMATADPVNRDTYEQNLRNLEQRLRELDDRIKAKLLPHEGARFFVFHPAFGYFADEYHLEQVAVEVEGKSPSPRQLFRIVAQARSENIRMLFIQPQFDPNSAEAVAEAIGGTVVELDPLAENIIANIEAMAEAIANSLNSAHNQ
ncbi:MAG: zinc ABC transporter substrate-binding protein [Desulfocapsaceae bacterium]|jgi:zinc transport system substrate-binding protein|nr:zinc ABC transporter substrate-binding protein [Desulfocapsaceae bacterium]